ncbi:hypothetical protein F441_01247 [Phytophthora nicotianae CJ01A1]|uniref:Jacalin-type lectin domain-containing protein n=2 Tax=Phytophthora nicotianae TaxID=4792 RepID=W2XTB9_PHYNI|nr:hypothetical protein L916_01177 [Phytophthora nicotianae]ETP25936.1 hypothetical protein F441_01247 [Phytophthora nicotianae CJ01A1]
MSRFVLQALATVALIAGGASALRDGLQLSETFGGPHGTKYSDVEVVSPGQTVQGLCIRSGERINGVGLEITSPAGEKTSIYHGGHGGEKETWTFGAGEYITGIEAHWGEKGDHTRIKYIKFTTNKNNTMDAGNPTKDIGKDTAPEGYQLGGFAGTCGKELDSVVAIWTKLEA